MILVTGASGKTGMAVTAELAARGASVRAFVRRPEQIADVQICGAADAVVGNLASVDDLQQAFTGVTALYHICPNMHPDEIGIARTVVAAAEAAGVHRLVYHSVLHPQAEEMPHHWQKLRVEEMIFQAGLDYTILQPAAYMQNVLAYWPAIVAEGVYRVPYALTTRLGMVDLADVAQAAGRVLTEEGHGGATYELAGPEVLSPIDVAAILSKHVGRSVRAEAVDRALWEENARRSGLGDYAIRTLLRMFEYYERYGFWGNPFVLTRLLGHAPHTFEEFLRRESGKG